MLDKETKNEKKRKEMKNADTRQEVKQTDAGKVKDTRGYRSADKLHI